MATLLSLLLTDSKSVKESDLPALQLMSDIDLSQELQSSLADVLTMELLREFFIKKGFEFFCNLVSQPFKLLTGEAHTVTWSIKLSTSEARSGSTKLRVLLTI